MKISDWLNKSISELKKVEIGSARLDCLILLEDCLGKNRAYIIANPDSRLTNNDLKTLNSWLKRRLDHEPLAYIRGFKEFYGHEFLINKDVMIPRPATEDMVDLVLEIADKKMNVLDVGTGSGAVAISIAINSKNNVSGSDVSEKAIRVAKKNAKNLNANVEFCQNYLLNNVNTHFDIIVANLPYVPKGMRKELQPELNYEPEVALWIDNDGLDLYRELFNQIKNMLLPPQHIITESLLDHHEIMKKLAKESGYKFKNIRGLTQHFVKI